MAATLIPHRSGGNKGVYSPMHTAFIPLCTAGISLAASLCATFQLVYNGKAMSCDADML